MDGISRRLPFASHINPDDIRMCLSFYKRYDDRKALRRCGIPSCKLRGAVLLVQSAGQTQFDTAGKPRTVVGIIADIDDEKRATEKLIDRAERDVLTKLYNKRAARHKISRFLELSQEAAVRPCL